MSEYEEIEVVIINMKDCEDTSVALNEIETAYSNGEITKEQKEELLDTYEEESLRVPLIDDYEWKLMGESDQ